MHQSVSKVVGGMPIERAHEERKRRESAPLEIRGIRVPSSGGEHLWLKQTRTEREKTVSFQCQGTHDRCGRVPHAVSCASIAREQLGERTAEMAMVAPPLLRLFASVRSS